MPHTRHQALQNFLLGIAQLSCARLRARLSQSRSHISVLVQSEAKSNTDMDDHGDLDDLVQLAKLSLGRQVQQLDHDVNDNGAAAVDDVQSEEDDSYNEAYDDYATGAGSGAAAAAKFMKAGSSKKAHRKARKAAAAAHVSATARAPDTTGGSAASSSRARNAAAAAPAGPEDAYEVAAGASSADERKQQQRKQQQVKATAAAAAGSSSGNQGSKPGASGSSSSSVGGIAEGVMSAAEQEMVKHALTQISELKQIAPFTFEIKQGSTRGMGVPARFFASPLLLDMVVSEAQASSSRGSGGFTASLQQLANVATLPGIVGASIGMPDLHSGYGFAIGNVCAVDLEGGSGVVSPGGVGFDINCGVRLLRSDLTIDDLLPARDALSDALFKAVPVGVGSEGSLRLGVADMDRLLSSGMAFLQEKGLSWPEDADVTEEHGCFPGADASKVSARAKARGAAQCGTLGSGNHYVEVQVVDELFDAASASVMGLSKGSVCVMIHSGSRGLGHQVCTDYLSAADRAMAKSGLRLVDRQLAAAPLSSSEGRDYLAAMAAAANFAFANRSLMAHHVRGAFQSVFKSSAAKLGLHQVYDVSHNIAKKELHTVPDGTKRQLLVHRKGATRAFPPGHPDVPAKYRSIGQPVLIGGSMGTASYVMTGTEGAMQRSFGSTCHGAGRALSRSAAMRGLDSKDVLSKLSQQGIAVRMATKKLAAEEAPESYKDVSQVIDTCHAVGISKKCVRLRPVIVVKG